MENPNSRYTKIVFFIVVIISGIIGVFGTHAAFCREQPMTLYEREERPKTDKQPKTKPKPSVPVFKDNLQADRLYSIFELQQNQSREERRFFAYAYFSKEEVAQAGSGITIRRGLFCDELVKGKAAGGSFLLNEEMPPEQNFVEGQRYYLGLGARNTSLTGTPQNEFRIMSFEKTCSREMEEAIKKKVVGTELTFIGEGGYGKYTKVVEEKDIAWITICDCGWVEHKQLKKDCYKVRIGHMPWDIYLDMDTLEQLKAEQLFVTEPRPQDSLRQETAVEEIDNGVKWANRDGSIEISLTQNNDEFALNVRKKVSPRALKIIYHTRINSQEDVVKELKASNLHGHSFASYATYIFGHSFTRTTCWMGIEVQEGGQRVDELCRTFLEDGSGNLVSVENNGYWK